MRQPADSLEPIERKQIASDAVPNSLPATCVHPGAIIVALAAGSYLVAAFWVTFAGGETSLDLAVVTLISVMMFGLIAGGGALARNVELDRKSTRSFREFVGGDVDIETGRITGREALLQITAIPIILAIGGTIILGGEVWARSNRVADLAAVATTSVSDHGVTLRSVSLDLPDPDRFFPGGEAADAINNNCLACHSAGMVLNQPTLSRDQWQAEVDKMRNTYKAPVAPQDVAAIVNYLADRSGKIAQLSVGEAAAASNHQ
jgi:hypothetical protein